MWDLFLELLYIDLRKMNQFRTSQGLKQLTLKQWLR